MLARKINAQHYQTQRSSKIVSGASARVGAVAHRDRFGCRTTSDAMGDGPDTKVQLKKWRSAETARGYVVLQPEKLRVARRAMNRAVVQPALVPEQAVTSNDAIEKTRRTQQGLVHSPPGAIAAGTCGRFVLAAASPAFLGACPANASACRTMIGVIAQRAITKVIVHAQAVVVACGYHTPKAAH